MSSDEGEKTSSASCIPGTQGLSAWVKGGWDQSVCLFYCPLGLWSDVEIWPSNSRTKSSGRVLGAGETEGAADKGRMVGAAVEGSGWRALGCARISSALAGGGSLSIHPWERALLSSIPLWYGTLETIRPSLCPHSIPQPLLLLSLAVKQPTRWERLAPGWQWGRRTVQKDFPFLLPSLCNYWPNTHLPQNISFAGKGQIRFFLGQQWLIPLSSGKGQLINLLLLIISLCYLQPAPIKQPQITLLVTSCLAMGAPGHCWQTQICQPQGKRRVQIPFSGLSRQRSVTVTTVSELNHAPIQVSAPGWTAHLLH